MGFLHKIWDETLAGPAPETGLSKLRKCNSLSAAGVRAPVADDVPISRAITLVRTQSGFKTTAASAPVSPSVPITPRTPFSPESPGGDFKKFTRKKLAAVESAGEHRSPATYDWIIMSALDRC